MYKKVLLVLLITFIVCGGFNLFNSQKNNTDDWQGVSIESKLSSNELRWIKEKQRIVVGVPDSLMPMVIFNDETGRGFLVDYMGIISDKINLEVVYKPILEKDIGDSLTNGFIDCALTIPDPTVKNDMDYTMPLLPVKGKLCVSVESDIKTEADIVNKKIILIKGQERTSKGYSIGKSSQFTTVDSVLDGFELLKTGKYDGLLGNEMAIDYYIKEENLQKSFVLLPNYMYEKNLVLATLQGSELNNIMNLGVYYVDKNRIFFSHNLYYNKKLYEKAIAKLSENVYITIDLDVFDPSIMPSTGTPEPGGPSYMELLHFLRDVINKRNVVGFDVVELCPNSSNKAPDFIAAKIIYQLLSYMYAKKLHNHS